MDTQKKHKTAILLGATGLVGGCVLQFLLENEAYTKVVALTRRPLSIQHQKLENVVLDFEQLLDYQSVIKGDDLFLCLGTTIKKAGSQAAFKRIDVDYQMQAATAAKQNGVSQVMLCSAVDADVNSKIFYNRMKGDLEDALKGMGFKSVHIFQPSILLGERNENRLGEKIGQAVGRFLLKITPNLWGKYEPVSGETVGKAMVGAALLDKKGVHVYASDKIKT
jgi:uncharacterized protein YbjT (DUF2867 family)